MQNLQNLYNQALSTIGADPIVTDPDALNKTTNQLNLWYPVARKAVLSAAHWPSVRAVKRLARAAERDESLDWANSDPAPGYKYSYALPSDMLQPQYMEDFARFEMGRVGSERLIFSNNPLPILRYTMDEAVPTLWESELYRCVIWALAASINMARSGKMAITQKLEGQVIDLISQATTNAANSDDTYFDSIPSFYNNSGFSVPDVVSRYYYPTVTYRVEGL